MLKGLFVVQRRKTLRTWALCVLVLVQVLRVLRRVLVIVSRFVLAVGSRKIVSWLFSCILALCKVQAWLLHSGKIRNDTKENKSPSFGMQECTRCCVLRTGSCVWHRWCETGIVPRSWVQSCRRCTGSPSVWKLSVYTKVMNFRVAGNFFFNWLGDEWVAVLWPGTEDGPYVSMSFCLVICLRCLLPT